MRPRRRPANQLRTAIDCLPVETRQAMLDGIDAVVLGNMTTEDAVARMAQEATKALQG